MPPEKLGETPQKYMTNILKTVEVIRNKESLRNCDSQRRLRKHDNQMQCHILNWVLEEEKSQWKND